MDELAVIPGVIVEPFAGAGGFSVKDPKIRLVMNRRTGEHHEVRDLLNTGYAEVVQLRNELTRIREAGERPLLVCSECQYPVFLRGGRDGGKRTHFAHYVEDGSCSAVTRGNVSIEQMDARKYNGSKESDDHIESKAQIVASLEADSRFSEVRVEPTIKNLTEWRRPDVHALFDGKPVAFEIQLSTTNLPVIVARMEHYRKLGTVVVWVFRSYRQSSTLMTQDDIFYMTHNLFLVNAGTLDASRAAGKLMLDCRWAKPVEADGKVHSEWDGAQACFHDFTLDRDRALVYYFDYPQAVQALKQQIAERDKRERPERLRVEFEQWWMRRRNTTVSYEEYQDLREQDGPWQNLRGYMRECGQRLPRYYGDDGTDQLLRMMYSIRDGVPRGQKFKLLVQSLHTFITYRSIARLLRVAMLKYDRIEMAIKQDKTGKWAKATQASRDAIKRGDPEYDHSGRYDVLLDYLFDKVTQDEKTRRLLYPRAAAKK